MRNQRSHLWSWHSKNILIEYSGADTRRIRLVALGVDWDFAFLHCSDVYLYLACVEQK
jgi:hypothetical protein